MVLTFSGNVPTNAEKIPDDIFSSYTGNTSSFINVRHLRNFRSGGCDIIRFTTIDPEAKLVFVIGSFNMLQDTIAVNLPPGTYTLLRCLASYSQIFIEHNDWVGADYTIEKFDLGKKVRKSLRWLSTNNPIFATIAGVRLAYYGGYMIRAEDAPVMESINIIAPPVREKISRVEKCKMCHQDLPNQRREYASRKEKDRISFHERFANMLSDGLLKME